MADQPFDQDEQDFLQAVGLDPNDLEQLVGDAPPLPADVQARMRARARRQIAAAGGRRGFARWKSVLAAAALVAGVSAAVLVVPLPGSGDVVRAMAQAVSQLQSYHAVIETRWDFSNPQVPDQVFQEEVWYQGDKYALRNRLGELTISDGDVEWTVYPKENYAYKGFVVAADLHRFSPANLARSATELPHTIEGDDEVNGRPTTRIRVTPSPGSGSPFQLWIDKETHLPIQFRHEVNGSVTTYTYKQFEVNPQMAPDRFTYQPPADYKVIDTGRRVATLAEAETIAGFKAVVPQEAPRSIIADPGGEIIFDYGDASIHEVAAANGLSGFRPTEDLGWTGGTPVRVLGPYLEWVQSGVWIRMNGCMISEWCEHPSAGRILSLARQMAPDLIMPQPDDRLYRDAQVEVAVDMEQAVALEQARMKDPSLHPERLQPLPVALRFAAEQAGAGAVDEATLTPVANNGVEAVYDLAKGPIKRVYLRKVARQDPQGSWWVIGYDPR